MHFKELKIRENMKKKLKDLKFFENILSVIFLMNLQTKNLKKKLFPMNSSWTH